jgi:hypothetical protein
VEWLILDADGKKTSPWCLGRGRRDVVNEGPDGDELDGISQRGS